MMAGKAIASYLLVISLIGLLTTATGEANDTTTRAGSTPTKGTTQSTTMSGGSTTMKATTTIKMTTERKTQPTTMPGESTTMKATTTMKMTTTTGSPVTPPNIPTFEARDSSRENVCMLIALDATVTFEGVESEVPADASIMDSPSECPDTAKTSFMELRWADQGREFTLLLRFEVMEDTYTMVHVNGSMTTEDGNETVISSWNEDGTLIPKTPVGQAIHCRNVTMTYVEFRQYQFQPFAQQSGGEFGEVMECEDDPDSGGIDTIWIIVICIIAGVGGIAAIGVVVHCLKKRRSTYESV